MKFNSTYYNEIVNDGRCCYYWRTEGLSDWQYDDLPQRSCDWSNDCSNTPDNFECIMIGEVPLLVIVIFVPFILCIFCAPLSLIWCQRKCSEQSSNQTSTPSNGLTRRWSDLGPIERASNRSEAAETPAPPLFLHKPAMPPPSPMAGVTMQLYQDLPPPPSYESSYRY